MEPKGFFSALLDFSFSEFITTKIIKFIYGLVILIGAILMLKSIFGAFHMSFAAGLGTLILAPLAFLLWICLARIYLEIVIVIFRIAENTRDMARLAQIRSRETPIPPPV